MQWNSLFSQVLKVYFIYWENIPLCVPFINLYKSNRWITLLGYISDSFFGEYLL